MKKLFLINMLLLTLLLQPVSAKELKYLPGSYLDTVSAHDAETGLAIMDPVNLTQSVNGINVIRFTYISDSRFINRQYFVIKILDDNNNCTMTINSCWENDDVFTVGKNFPQTINLSRQSMDNIYSLLDNMKTEYINDQTKAQEIYPPNTIPLSRRDGPDITYILETNISSNYNLYYKENARFNSEFYKLCSELIELSNCGKKILNETDYNNWYK